MFTTRITIGVSTIIITYVKKCSFNSSGLKYLKQSKAISEERGFVAIVTVSRKCFKVEYGGSEY